MKQNKLKLGVFYWHNPTRIGNLQLVNELRNNFEITLISNEDIPSISKFSDHIIVGSYGDSKELIDKLKKHKKIHGLDGLITLSEGAVTLMADSAEQLKLRGNPASQTRIGRNKYLMREKFREVGIPQPSFHKVATLDEALHVAKTEFKGKHFFLKPPCLGGSSFCSIIKDQDQLKKLWQNLFEGSKTRTKKDPLFEEQFGVCGENYYMLIEELLGGTNFDYDDILGVRFPIFEMSVEGFIDGKETLVYSMTDKLLPRDCQSGEEYMWRMHSRIPFELKEILKKRVTKINQSLGAFMGCSHTEFRIEETDQANADIEFANKFYRARLIETALRPGGAFMQTAIFMATGFNSIRAMADQACGIDNKEQVLYRFPMIMANLWPEKAGILDRIENLDKILSLKENLAVFHLYDGVGDTVQVPPEASRGIADAVLWGKSVDLLTCPNWEIGSGENNLYKEVEDLYLQVVKDFKPIIK